MSKEDTTVMSEAISKKFPWTSEDLATEFHMKPQYFRVWKNKMEKAKKLPKPAIGSLYCIQDPEHHSRLLYSDSYFERLQALRGTVKTPTKRYHAESGRALMKITVPLFDQNVVNYLLKKFKDEYGVESHLKDHLRDLALPALSKIEELKRRHQKELDELLSEM